MRKSKLHAPKTFMMPLQWNSVYPSFDLTPRALPKGEIKRRLVTKHFPVLTSCLILLNSDCVS